MLLLVGSIILFFVGVVVAVNSYGGLIELFGGITGWVFGIFSLILLMAWGFAYMNNSDSVYEYTQNKLYIESLGGNKQLTDEERRKAVDVVLSTNNDILKTRRWKDNLVVGIYYSRAVGDLELLDINKVPQATKNYKIDLKQ